MNGRTWANEELFLDPSMRTLAEGLSCLPHGRRAVRADRSAFKRGLNAFGLTIKSTKKQ
jgi:hypothetical protein